MQPKTNAQKAKELFFAYFTSMLFAFTGGNVVLPLIQEKLADKYNLLSREKTLEYFALAQSLPGVISISASILIGRDVAGWLGAFAAVAGSVVPAFFGMLFITLSYTVLSQLQFIYSAIGGIRAASVAIILVNAFEIAGGAKTTGDWLIVAFALIATLVLGWNILLVVLLCGGIGALRLVRKKKPPTE